MYELEKEPPTEWLLMEIDLRGIPRPFMFQPKSFHRCLL
jgi:hypothetical protein